MGSNRFLLIFVGLFILTLPFEQPLLPAWQEWLNPFWVTLYRPLGEFLGLSPNADYRLASDSAGLYIHSGILLLVAATSAFVWMLMKKSDTREKIYAYILRSLATVYLSMHLFNYGFSKIFKVQFFQAEPNTLFTPLGQLSHDLVFWSSMGSSYSYTVFAGVIEIIPAFLLLFRRTRLLGAFIATAVLINVLMLNLGFDISVKLFTTFLLLLCAILLLPDAKRLYRFFSNHSVEAPNLWQPSFSPNLHKGLKFAILLFLLVNGLYPYWKVSNFNDDRAERPFLHGAYEVEDFVFDGDSLAPSLTNTIRWRRLFVHRRGYFIVQNMQDKMKDFQLEMDKDKGLLRLQDYDKSISRFRFTYQDSILSLQGTWKGHQIAIRAKQIDLKKLPLLKPAFHWTVD